MKHLQSYTIILKRVSILMIYLLIHVSLNAQTPRNVPQPHDTYSFHLDSLSGLILYIGLPVIIIILYLLYRRREKHRKEK